LISKLDITAPLSAASAKIKRNIHRATRSKKGLEIFEKFALELYGRASGNNNNSGADHLDGGDAVLTIASVKKFCTKLQNLCKNCNLYTFNILWVIKSLFYLYLSLFRLALEKLRKQFC
jgi:hypothetical protein